MIFWQVLLLIVVVTICILCIVGRVCDCVEFCKAVENKSISLDLEEKEGA